MLLPTREDIIESLARTPTSGSLEIQCMCGRIHFTADNPEELDQKAEENPDQYVYCDYSHVSWFDWRGNCVVLDCPCENAYKIGAIIWDHRFLIADFLTEISRRETKQAKRNQDCANQINSAIAD